MNKPYWETAGDYAYTKSLDRVGWAWEFLRRNPEYRKDFEALSCGEFDEWAYEPPKKTSETVTQWVSRCILENGSDPQRFRPEHNLARKWGLSDRLYHPAKRADELKNNGNPVQFDVDVDPEFIEQWEHLFDIPVIEEPGGVSVVRRDRLVVMFDLTGSITPQFAKVKKKFAQAQKNLYADVTKKGAAGKPKATAFLQGIRALDALGEGASNHEIGKVLFDDDQSNIDVHAKNCIDSAIRNMTFGYKAIARRRTPLH